MPESILIVEDDPVQRRLLQATVTRAGHEAILAEHGEAALELLADSSAQEGISVVVLDLMMPGIDGIEVLNAMQDREISIPVIVQTAQGGIETVVSAMRAGAFDFVVKPVSPDRLVTAIANALKLGKIERQVRQKRKPATADFDFDDIVCASPAMHRVLETGRKAASSRIPVLIEGESGVGKELIARAIQGSSPRKGKPFVTVNCGALPENLVESILFGHEKGAFTGATDKHVGKFEEANGGTLFLDEIGELPLDIQVKLLRAIQEGEIDPVGAKKPVKVDIRLVSATNRDLATDIREGRFREDLYYRLNVLPLCVPPLRERREDIPKLLRHFAERYSRAEGRESVVGISPGVHELIAAYDWPGNIRQLENAVFRAVVLSEGDTLLVEDFPQIASQMEDFELPDPAPLQPAVSDMAGYDPGLDAHSAQPSTHSTGSPAYGHLALVSEEGLVRSLEEIEADVIRFAIEACDGKMSEVARRLGIGRSTLYRKLKDYGLEADRQGSAPAA